MEDDLEDYYHDYYEDYDNDLEDIDSFCKVDDISVTEAKILCKDKNSRHGCSNKIINNSEVLNKTKSSLGEDTTTNEMMIDNIYTTENNIQSTTEKNLIETV